MSDLFLPRVKGEDQRVWGYFECLYNHQKVQHMVAIGYQLEILYRDPTTLLYFELEIPSGVEIHSGAGQIEGRTYFGALYMCQI